MKKLLRNYMNVYHQWVIKSLKRKIKIKKLKMNIMKKKKKNLKKNLLKKSRLKKKKEKMRRILKDTNLYN